MISDEMIKLVEGSSAIRAMFEEGKKLASICGAEKYMTIHWVILQ